MRLARRTVLRGGLGLTVAASTLVAAPLTLADTTVDPIGDLLARTTAAPSPQARRLAFDNLHGGEPCVARSSQQRGASDRSRSSGPPDHAFTSARRRSEL